MNGLVKNYYTRRDQRIKELQRHSPYETPLTIEEVRDVPYAAADYCLADFYAPLTQSNKGMPLMIVLHDNPFDGDKKGVRPFALEMAKRGILVVSPNYSLAGAGLKDPFAQQLADVFCFLNWLHVAAPEMGLSFDGKDKDAIPVRSVVLTGIGTGGHLAVTALNAAGNLRMREYWASKPLADYVADPLPIDALATLASILNPRRVFDNFLFGWAGQDRFGKDYRARKGLDYLDFAVNLSVDCPPVLMVTSDKDPSLKDNLAVEAALTKLGKSVHLLRFPSQEDKERKLRGAFSALYPMWKTSKEANERIAAFVKSLAE